MAAYDVLRTDYDTKTSSEETRRKDFFKAAFDAPIAIPTRPCPPTAPVMPSSGTFATIATPATMVKDTSYFTIFDGTSTAAAQATSLQSTGYLQVAVDEAVAITEGNTPNVGHIYGRHGQGNETMSNGTQAWGFQWEDASFASNPTSVYSNHNLMVSILPYDAAATVYLTAAANTIEIHTIGVAFRSLASITAAPTPNGVTQPRAALSAQALIATTFAAAAVAATLL